MELLSLPLIVGRGTDAVAPPGLVDGAAGIGLFQDRHDLGLGERRLTQGNLLARVTIVPVDSPVNLFQIGGELTPPARKEFRLWRSPTNAV